MIERELLGQCGLNSTEQRVLLDLLQRRGSPAGAIAKRLALKRATAYSALQSLETLGLVLRRKEGSVTSYSTVPPTMVPTILCDLARSQFLEVQRASELLAKQMRHYEKLTKQNVAGYEISTTDSKDAAFLLLYEALIGGDFVAIFDLESAAVDQMEDYLDQFLHETARTHPHIRDIVVDGPRVPRYLGMIDNPNHRVKVLPSSYRIITDFVITDDSVYLTNYNPGGEMLIQIKHRDYYDSMMSVFNFTWEHLPLTR